MPCRGPPGDPNPNYHPRNDWQHGFAIVEVTKKGNVYVENRTNLMIEEGLVFADGFDSCILGIMVVDEVPRVVYDKYAMVNCMRLAEADLSFEDAVEFLEYNVGILRWASNTHSHLYTFDGVGSSDEKRPLSTTTT